jgi:methionine--tRNA ligase beta chain
MISIDDFKKCEIRVGEILSVEVIEASEKLLKLSVSFGEESPRTVVSGIRKYFEDPQTLVGTKCAFATNLEPRPLMGIPSEAMILAATSDDKFSLLRVDQSLPPGVRVN